MGWNGKERGEKIREKYGYFSSCLFSLKGNYLSFFNFFSFLFLFSPQFLLFFSQFSLYLAFFFFILNAIRVSSADTSQKYYNKSKML